MNVLADVEDTRRLDAFRDEARGLDQGELP